MIFDNTSGDGYLVPDINAPDSSFVTDYNSSSDVGTIADSSGTGGWVTGLADIFQAVGTTATSIYRQTQTPSQGQLVFNPNTGTYQPAGSMTPRPGTVTSSLATNPQTQMLLVFAGVAILAIVLLKKG